MQGGGGRGGAMSFGKSKAKMQTEDQVKVTFKDVAGCDEAKVELKEIVDKLRNYYIPCKAKTYLEEISIPRSIVILRQFLKCHGYTLFSKEKFIKSKKHTIYKIVTIDKEVSTPQKKEKVVVSFD